MSASKCCVLVSLGFGLLVLGLSHGELQAASPTAEQALTLKPIQSDVDYDIPTAEEAAKCTIQTSAGQASGGWVVFNPGGQMLRRFLDTNADNKVDLWCYYKNGIEVYRDIDSNFNGKADQYRWIGTAGIRWGLDENEDGVIDRWKSISAEEVASELVGALRTRDAVRFQRLLLSAEELKALGLGEVQTRDLAKKIAAASQGFAELAQRQTVVGKASEWGSFGASHPGVVPAGWEGSKKDVIVYDSASAIVTTEGKHSQITLGTLIQVSGGWRMIDLPQNLLESQVASASGGYFFQEPSSRQPDMPAPAGGLSEAELKLIGELERIDKSLAAAASAEQLARLNADRADILEKLIEGSARAENRDAYTRQFADSVSAAVQSGGYADGVVRLKKLADKVAADAANPKTTAYVVWRYLSADYARNLQQPNVDPSKVQDKWIADLRKYVEDYPRSEDAPEAMLQLAVSLEFGGKTDEATEAYGRVVQAYATAEVAKKAAGAKRRLESPGKVIDLKGVTLDGKKASLVDLRGRVVLVQYWATWCEPCKQDMALLKQLQVKYAKQGFTLLGVNLDSDRAAATAFLQTNALPWPQLYEPGGLDSRFAQELGIMTLPTLILVDKEGKVLNRSAHAGELDEELSKRLK